MGIIASGIVFMFLRAFYKNQVQIKEETDTTSATTDHLEANRIILEINDSNFTPLFASILLVSDVYYNPTNDVKMCVDSFFLGQVFQAVGFLFWSFTPLYVLKGSPWRNTVVPKLIFITCDSIFVYIPAAKVVVYLIYVYRSSLLE